MRSALTRTLGALLLGAGTLEAQVSLPTLRLGAPIVQVGSSSGPIDGLLAGVIGATRLANGLIAIGDGSTPRIILFTAEGKIHRSLGRDGDGPGELRMPRWLGRCEPDGFAAYDAAQSRLTLFSGTGEVRRTIPVPPVAGFNHLIACLPGSQFFLLSRSGVSAVTPGTKGIVSTALARIRGTLVDTVSTSIGGQEYYVDKARRGFAEVPLGQMVLATSGPTRIYLCTNQEGRCTVFDTAGTQRGSFAIDLKRESVSAGDWDRARHRMIEAEPRVQSHKPMALVLEDLPKPPEFPLIDQIRADVGDRLWVRTFTGYGSDLATWLILRPGGRPMAKALLPSGLRVLEIGKDYLLGVLRDADGVESVGLYRFQLPA